MSGRAATVLLSRERVPWLHSGPLARLLSVLDADGEETRVVGGAVRNTLLGIPRGDVDLATTAVPDVVMQRVTAAGFHPVPTGIAHGTITVVVEGRPFEVTTLRQDIETDGRHAVVRFGRDWQADAERRDFTINALFLRRDGEVVDHVGGLADIEARRVRFIGDPHARIAEDVLRVLRFFRFHAAYGSGPPDPEGLAACIQARGGLENLSRERVRIEMLKLLPAAGAPATAVIMSDCGILEQVLGGVADLAALQQLAAIEAALSLPPDPIRRLAALAVRTTEDATRLRERLRLSNEEHRRLRAMAEKWWRITRESGEDALRRLLYRIGPDNFRDRVLLAFARSGAAPDDATWRRMLALPERWTPARFPLAAKDFIEHGVARGPELGAALAHAEEAWIDAGFPEESGKLGQIIQQAIKTAREPHKREQ